jgi:putative two-component system response regulator
MDAVVNKSTTLRSPAANPQHVAAPSRPVPAQDAPSEQTILVVDDLPANLVLMADLLQPHYRVRTSTSGARALRLAHIQPVPDLILLDIMMPHLGGYEVLARLRADPMTRHIPVIFITASGDSDPEGEGLDLGADDYITRPFSPAAVLTCIRDLLQRARAQQLLAEHATSLAAEVAREAVAAEHLQDVTILALARLAQSRDRETGNHLKRTQEYVRIVASQMCACGLHPDILTPKSVVTLAKSALLHDIGKAAVPDRILLKTGPLTAVEWEIMRTHAREGRDAIDRAERLAGIPADFLGFAKEICESHHERWDGSGYPAGLVGTAIPLSARLMAVADVFDALTSTRPYRPASSPGEARQMIIADRGRHFDPDIVDAFLACFGEFEAVAERYADVERC